jgi:hypothetical protein
MSTVLESKKGGMEVLPTVLAVGSAKLSQNQKFISGYRPI